MNTAAVQWCLHHNVSSQVILPDLCDVLRAIGIALYDWRISLSSERVRKEREAARGERRNADHVDVPKWRWSTVRVQGETACLRKFTSDAQVCAHCRKMAEDMVQVVMVIVQKSGVSSL